MGWYPCCCRRSGTPENCPHCLSGTARDEATLQVPDYEFGTHRRGYPCYLDFPERTCEDLNTDLVLQLNERYVAGGQLCESRFFFSVLELIENTDPDVSSCALWCQNFCSVNYSAAFLFLEAHADTTCRLRAVVAQQVTHDSSGRNTNPGYAAHVYASEWAGGPIDWAQEYELPWVESVESGFGYCWSSRTALRVSF